MHDIKQHIVVNANLKLLAKPHLKQVVYNIEEPDTGPEVSAHILMTVLHTSKTNKTKQKKSLDPKKSTHK